MSGISNKALNFGKDNKKGYAGNEIQNKEFSDGSGLDVYDFNARTYDQQIGRFIQVDPMTDEGGQESWSPYHYSYNNPVTFSDPDGKFPIPIIWAIYAILTSEAAVTTAAVATTAYVAYKTAPEINISATGSGTAAPAMSGSAAQLDLAVERQVYKNSRASTSSTTSSTGQGAASGGTLGQVGRVLTKGHGGGKNAQHTNQKAKEAASKKLEEAKKQLKELESRTNKTKEDVAATEKAKNQVKHLQKKANETGENHSQKAKGGN